MNDVVHYGAFPAALPTPARPGPWRILAILALLVSVALVAAGLAVSYSRSDVGEDGFGQSSETTRLEVIGLGDSRTLSAEVLGLAAPVPQDVDDLGRILSLEIPARSPYVVAVHRNGDDLVGLAYSPGLDLQPNAVVRVTPDSTARALLALSPAVIDLDPTVVINRVNQLAQTEQYGFLVQAVIATTDLRRSDPALEAAIANVLNQIAPVAPAPLAGCDSIGNDAAFPAAGACAIPNAETGQLSLLNNQNRWIVVFGSIEPGQICAVVPPAQVAGGSYLLDADGDCGTSVDLAAPGPFVVVGEQSALVGEEVAVAAALNALWYYGIPFLDAAGGGSGIAAEAGERITADPQTITTELVMLFSENRPLRQAANALTVEGAAANERSRTAIEISRAAFELPALMTGLSPDLPLVDQGSDAAALLDLFARVSEQQTASGFLPAWQAEGFARLQFAEVLPG